MDDIAAGVIKIDEKVPALKNRFDCLRESGLTLSVQKCKFGTPETIS